MKQSMRDESKGCVHVYTGNGKGKTTAALGLAFRAMGAGKKVYIGQFMKGMLCSEHRAAQCTDGMITIEQYGPDHFISYDNPSEEDRHQAALGLANAMCAMCSERYDIIVLDEAVTACHFSLLSMDDLTDVIARKPHGIELVLTGRGAKPELVKLADLVTEMVEQKHYHTMGIPARRGIEM